MTTRCSTQTPELFRFKPRRDRATKLLTYLGDVIVNGNPTGGRQAAPGRACARRRVPPHDRQPRRRRARANCCVELGPKKFAEWTRDAEAAADHRHDVPRRAPIAAGHARAHLRHAGASPNFVAHRAARICSAWKCGAARRSTSPCGFCTRIRGSACASCAKRIPNICFQMLLRGSNAVGYSAYPDNVVREFRQASRRAGHRYFPHLRFAELAAQPEGGDGGRAARPHAICEAAICYTGDILDPRARQVFAANITSSMAQGTGENGRAHSRHQGHGRAVQALRGARSW